jgi:glycosyltransferase involved in cell wall biosynthesis
MVSKACVSAAYRGKLREMVQQAGLDLVLVVPPVWGSLPYEPAADEPFRTLVSPVRLSGRNHLHWYPALGRILAAERPALLHVDEEHYSLVTGLAFQKAVRLAIPAVFFTWQNLYKRYPLPFAALEQYVFRHAAGAIAGNAEAVSVLRKKRYRGPVAVIPQFGTDPQVFRPRARSEFRSEWGFGDDETVIGYVGRLVPEKGVDVLVEAALPFLKPGGDVRLVLAGSGPERDALERALQGAGVEGAVRFVPWVPSERMPDLMNGLDILVLPSRTTPRWKEQFGRVLPEAMASELAVVGSRSGEIPEVIGEAGLVFDEDNAYQLREALRLLLDHPAERRRLGEAGRARVEERFSQRVVAQSTVDFYNAVLTQAGRP